MVRKSNNIPKKKKLNNLIFTFRGAYDRKKWAIDERNALWKRGYLARIIYNDTTKQWVVYMRKGT